MTPSEFETLLTSYTSGTCSQEERELVESWYTHAAEHSDMPPLDAAELAFYRQKIWNGLEQPQPLHAESHRAGRKLWLKFAAAASVLIAVFAGYQFLGHKSPKPKLTAVRTAPDILPAANKAFLVLPDGREVNISNLTEGTVAQFGHMTVRVKGKGVISYKIHPSVRAADRDIWYTIKTPAGGQWPVVELPDGTKVHLDAASSVSFPLSFAGRRTVSMTGQVFFQVVHDESRPFHVRANGIDIEDLGTDFNVKAYPDEQEVETTLVEGLVRVSKDTRKVMLVPGQQAVSRSKDARLERRQADVIGVLAWKNGVFHFDHTSIEEVMQQLARWYKVEITYRKDVSEVTFTGDLPRNLKLSRLLEMLSVTGLRFKVDGRKIEVTN
ncbi:hypothetical protein C7T94_14615 [Pedobacter yulinensis]|uniref:Anti-sigma factor n=1 Tax=Pedobacter yulinensis TaxID=2126353 RepID=A0A2T3HHW3_9SPHI|nr:FecR family protein [Pedobacter yulinensis]PST82046.1 hypothetical protein C7T94_14615 [Pedobacter yulinensis]